MVLQGALTAGSTSRLNASKVCQTALKLASWPEMIAAVAVTDHPPLGTHNVAGKERQQLDATAFESDRDLFGAGDQAVRARRFFTMDETETLRCPVSTLAAMADALESLPDTELSAQEVQDLRRIAKCHGYLLA